VKSHRVGRLQGRAAAFALVVVFGCLLAAAGTAAAHPATSTTYPGATNTSFRPPNLKGQNFHVFFGSSVNTSKIPILHAIGMLAKWGASTKIDYVDSNQIAIGALLQGQADAEVDGIDGGVTAFQAGQGIQAFALSQPSLDYGFICKKSITSVSDLTPGLTIGVVDTTGINPLNALMVAKRAGLSASQVKLIIVGGQSSRAGALIGGRIDCTILGTSNLLALEAQGYHTIYSFIKNAPGLWGDIVYSTPKWLASHKTMALALNEALLLSYRWVDNPKNKNAYIQETLADVPGTEQAEVSQLYRIYTANHLVPPNSILTTAGLTYNQAKFHDFNLQPELVASSQLGNVTYAKLALKKVGLVGKKKH
jgi:ABC-type nitrate/sulfonate/bicarbonate transport system substrate-binding protein